MTTENQIEPRPPEGIRAWYRRKTRKSIIALIGATVILLVAAVVVWLTASMDGLSRAQTFNGALTIPGFGALWIASFMFIWLIPMREVSFRGQETFERMEEKLSNTVDEKLVPVLESWQRVGERLENVILPKMEEAIEASQRATAIIEKKAGPAIEVARRLEAAIEAEVQTGLLKEMRDAAQSVQLLVMTKGEAPEPAPDISRTLSSIGKGSNGSVGGRR